MHANPGFWLIKNGWFGFSHGDIRIKTKQNILWEVRFLLQKKKKSYFHDLGIESRLLESKGNLAPRFVSFSQWCPYDFADFFVQGLCICILNHPLHFTPQWYRWGWEMQDKIKRSRERERERREDERHGKERERREGEKHGKERVRVACARGSLSLLFSRSCQPAPSEWL